MNYSISSEPYPGLRPFKREEVDIFFGRDDHVNEMVDKLAANHFVCVTGPSGCGKSSLAKTGLMNALEAGFLPGAGSDWLFVDMRPGSDPLEALVKTLAKAIIDSSDHDLIQRELELMFRKHLETRSYDLNSAIALMQGLSDRPVLLLIDQFEELFRFAQKDKHAATTFVEVLLNTYQACSNVYVVLTIRTEELENCSRYPGLTSAINSSQFLTPTLDRFQIQEAIEGPITVFNGKIDPVFSVWLLNNVDQFLDKLPILQHTLKLLYTRKLRELEKRKEEDAPVGSEDSGTIEGMTLGMSDFHEAFQTDTETYKKQKKDRLLLRVSFSVELNRIYNELPKSLQRGARRLFCELTDIDTKGRDIRRPRTVQQIADSIGFSTSDTWKIVNHFIMQDVEYLYVRHDLDNPDSSTLDVSHECILRLWSNLQHEWLVEEQYRADDIRMLASFAKNHEELRRGRPIWSKIFGSGLLDGYTVQRYTNWFGKEKPTAQWADRFLKDVNWQVKKDGSIIEHDNKKKFSLINGLLLESRWRRGVRIGALCIAVVSGLCWTFYGFYSENQRALAEVEETAKQRIEQAELEKNKAINKSNEIELEYQSAIGRLISGTVDNVENERPVGASLYDPQAQSANGCLSDETFCGRLNLREKAQFKLGFLQDIVSKPLCQNTDYASNISQIGSPTQPFCSFYPNSEEAVASANSQVTDADFLIRDEALQILNSPTQVSKAKARSILFGLAKKYPNEPLFFSYLSEGYRKDIGIAQGRRFSETNACKARRLQLLCGGKHSAFTIYREVNVYSNEFLRSVFADGKFYVLNKDITALKIMMMAEFLDEATMSDVVQASEASIERISRLWRGVKGASDAARSLYKTYDCANNEANIPQCKVADELYETATQALSVFLEHSKRTTIDAPTKLRTQLAYGIGLTSLHWGQDSNFRKIAKSSISQDDMIAELEKAYVLTKTPRYPSGLSILYCLNRNYAKAVEKAQAIRSEKSKYTKIKTLAMNCDQATDLVTHFDVPNPSE